MDVAKHLRIAHWERIAAQFKYCDGRFLLTKGSFYLREPELCELSQCGIDLDTRHHLFQLTLRLFEIAFLSGRCRYLQSGKLCKGNRTVFITNCVRQHSELIHRLSRRSLEQDLIVGVGCSNRGSRGVVLVLRPAKRTTQRQHNRANYRDFIFLPPLLNCVYLLFFLKMICHTLLLNILRQRF